MAQAPGRVSDPTLAELLRRLVPAYRPERVYLFGSRARERGSIGARGSGPRSPAPSSARAGSSMPPDDARLEDDEPFRKTHCIEEIGRACAAIDPSLGDLVDGAAPLTEYAWKFRHPGDAGEPSREEAERAVAVARRLARRPHLSCRLHLT